MLAKFKTYQLALEFHRLISDVNAPTHLRDQVLRASSSVVLNIAEGSAKLTLPDRRRSVLHAPVDFFFDVVVINVVRALARGRGPEVGALDA
jgi:hypothetical protein